MIPWLRKHIQVGGRILRIAPRSMVLEASIAEWQLWTGLEFPQSGPYIIPGGAAPLEVSLELGRAKYVEPNVGCSTRLQSWRAIRTIEIEHFARRHNFARRAIGRIHALHPGRLQPRYQSGEHMKTEDFATTQLVLDPLARRRRESRCCAFCKRS